MNALTSRLRPFLSPKWMLLALLLGFGMLRFVVSVAGLAPLTPKCDFNFRFNEALCLRKGVNPHAILSGEAHLPGFVPMSSTWGGACPWAEDLPDHEALDDLPANARLIVHTYPPWSYSLMLPLTYMGRRTAWFLYLSMNLGAFVLIGRFLYQTMLRKGQGHFMALLTVAAFLNLGKPIVATFMFGNYGALVTASLVGMIVFSEKNRQVVAGTCLALAMVKPQLGIPFLIPLLIGRRFKTVATTTILCALASLPPAVLCNTNPLELLRNAAGSGAIFFDGTPLLPRPVANLLFPGMSPSHLLPITAAAGLFLCVHLSLKTKRAPLWTDRMAPAALMSLLWMVARTADHIVLAIPLVSLLASLRDRENRTFRRTLWLLLPALFIRNAGSVVGDKARWLADALEPCLGALGHHLLALRTIFARHAWEYQGYFLLVLAVLLSLRMGTGGESLERTTGRKEPL